MISSIYFENFKVLEKYSISLKKFNILVGVNNSGKSTILDSLRILYGAYRYASRFRPKQFNLPNGKEVFGWKIPDSSIPILLENIQTDYNDKPAIIKYRFRENKSLSIYFFKGYQTVLALNVNGKLPRTAIEFRKIFNITLAIVPTLSPFEIEENVVEHRYLKRWEGSRRASRLFRNIWYQNPENFDEFKNTIEETWPGMSISAPEILDFSSSRLTMFFQENRITREICWAGFGFQIWMQLLTHIIKNSNADLIVIDEPEIYLHPDLQHKILGILRDTNATILLATHSSEIINEAEPNEVLVIDRLFKSAKRLTNLTGLQYAIDIIGSSQNINLTRLARGKRILFVEGKDIKLLRRLAKIAGFDNIFERTNLTIIPIEGFSHNERITGTHWTFSKIISEKVKIMALFDRDFRCPEEINEFIEKLSKITMFTHVLNRKEIENYFLDINAIQKAINYRLKSRNIKINNLSFDETKNILIKISDYFKSDVYSQLAAHKYKYLSKKGIDLATIIKKEQSIFENNWKSLDFRFSVIPGKKFFSLLNSFLQKTYKISITYFQISNYMSRKNLDSEIVFLFEQISRNAS